MLIYTFMERHAEIFDCEHRIWLDNFSWIVSNTDLSAVQMGQYKVKTSKGLKQGDLLLHEEICTLTLEDLMLFLLNNDN